MQRRTGLALFTSFLLCSCMGSELGNLESKQHDLVANPVAKAAYDAELSAACGDGGVTTDGDAALMRWPYLQKMTDHSVAIMWTAPADEPPAELRITRPDGEVVAELEASVDPQSQRDDFTQFATEVDGLEPDAIYCYEIAGDSTWLAPTGFKTAPATGSAAPVRLLVIGDLGTQTSDQLAVRDAMADVPFDLVLVVGDLAYESGTLGDHERNFFAVYRELLARKPFFVISGNHDYASDGAIFREVFGLFENGGSAGRERWYSFDWGPLHVTAIDTEVAGGEQADWVAKDLAATDQPWRLAMMHKPLYSSGSHGSSTTLQDLFAGSFERHDVDLVLAGHDHNYERTESIGGVTYVVTGSAGRGTRPVTASGFTAYSESVAHFTHVEVDGGQLQLNAIDALGGDFDSVVLGP